MGDVLVLVDTADGAVKKSTSELLTLARRLGTPVAVWVGGGIDDAAVTALGEFGATTVCVADAAALVDHPVAPKAELLARWDAQTKEIDAIWPKVRARSRTAPCSALMVSQAVSPLFGTGAAGAAAAAAGAASAGAAVAGAAVGTAGTASSEVVTVQGIASMTPFLSNPGTAANWGIGATGAAPPANGVQIMANTSGATGGLQQGLIQCALVRAIVSKQFSL